MTIDPNKVHLVPYTEINGIRTFSDTFILSILERMYDEGTYFTYFFGEPDYNPQRILQQLKYEQKAMSYILIYDDDLVGVIALDKLQFHHAFGHCFMFKKWWGTQELVDITKTAVNTLLEMYAVIAGIPPVINKHGINFLRKLGFKEQCTIPNYYTNVDGEFVDGAMFTIVRRECDG